MDAIMEAKLDKAFPVVDSFWSLYTEFLAVEFQKPADNPTYGKYAYVPEGTTPEAWAPIVAWRMRAAVACKGFGEINYTGSPSFRKAAKAVGVPFNRLGLDTLAESPLAFLAAAEEAKPLEIEALRKRIYERHGVK